VVDAERLTRILRRVADDVSVLRRYAQRPAADLSRDAAALGLAAGDRIEIASANGSAPAVVELADDVRPGVISVAHGFPNTTATDCFRGTSTSALVDDETDYDTWSGLPRMSALPVRVRAAG